MKNISFDNPYLLLIAIPMVLAVIIPFFISRSKDNKSGRWLASLILHIVLIISVALAAAGLTHTTVKTRTKVYILADVSYSSNRNLDKIDEYIEKINDSLPPNSMLGVVCFGKDTEILVSSGTALRSVKESSVDDSSSNIAGAIEDTMYNFSKDEIKRIIIITDGFATENSAETAAKVEEAIAQGIKIDAIYLDNNLKEGEDEVQISDVSYTGATYLDHDSSAGILIESNTENEVELSLHVKAEDSDVYTQIDNMVMKVDVGMNMASFKLPTNVSGIFDYKVELKKLAGRNDLSAYNNVFSFTQTVAGKKNVLLITGNSPDIDAFVELYGTTATISSYLINSRNKNIPYTIEDLSQYDEMIVSNVDIREINNINAFIDSAEAVISQYGKSLLTFGDLHIQNTDDPVFARFEGLLPVSFGNANKDSKLYTIIIDISRSMAYSNHAQFRIAKDAASKLVSILEDDDYVSLVSLSGEARVELTPTRLGDCRERLYQMIQGLELNQGTFIGEALDMAYDLMKDLSFEEKQVMLLSDGKTYTHEPEDASAVAERMKNDDILLSTVAVLNHSPSIGHVRGCAFLSDLAAAGGGIFYEIDREERVAEIVFAEIGDNITESVIEGKVDVNINSFHDGTMDGIIDLPHINGYVNSKEKLDSTMVLSVDYRKNSSTTVQVPLYSYRYHGNGRVASFTSNISGDWLSAWSKEDKYKFFGNVLETNTPPERIDYPYELTFEHSENSSSVTIAPTNRDPEAKAEVVITSPSGKKTRLNPVFDLNRYTAVFDTEEIGRYHIQITYTADREFVSNTYYTVSYGAEYDAFAAYDVANVHDFMRGLGRVSTDGDLSLENDKADIETYELEFRAPLLILAVVLFVIDVFIRKFGWKDIKGFFRRSPKPKI